MPLLLALPIHGHIPAPCPIRHHQPPMRMPTLACCFCPCRPVARSLSSLFLPSLGPSPLLHMPSHLAPVLALQQPLLATALWPTPLAMPAFLQPLSFGLSSPTPVPALLRPIMLLSVL